MVPGYCREGYITLGKELRGYHCTYPREGTHYPLTLLPLYTLGKELRGPYLWYHCILPSGRNSGVTFTMVLPSEGILPSGSTPYPLPCIPSGRIYYPPT